MAINLVKLCVGAADLDHVQAWIDRRMAEPVGESGVPEHYHITRMTPRRDVELLDGGSLYWVIKGSIQGRQSIRELRAITGEDGIRRCKIILEPVLMPTTWMPRRAFQGWRYLKPEDAPRDLDTSAANSLPAELQIELNELGLL